MSCPVQSGLWSEYKNSNFEMLLINLVSKLSINIMRKSKRPKTICIYILATNVKLTVLGHHRKMIPYP